MTKKPVRYKPGDLCLLLSAVTGDVVSGSSSVLILEEKVGYANAPGYSHKPGYVYTILWESRIEERISPEWLTPFVKL